MRGSLNPFLVLAGGVALVVIDGRRAGVDLFPNLLGFGLLAAGALVLRESAVGPSEQQWLLAAAVVSALGAVASFPLLSVPGLRYYVLPYLPWETGRSLAAWGSLAAVSVANGALLLALRERVRALGGNPRFEARARLAAIVSFVAPALALALEVGAENLLVDVGAQGVPGTALVLAVAVLAIFVYVDARDLWGRPRSRPTTAPTEAPEGRRR